MKPSLSLSLILATAVLLAACSSGSPAAPSVADASGPPATAAPAEDAAPADNGPASEESASQSAASGEQLTGISTGIGSASQCEVTSSCTGGGPIRTGLCGQVTDSNGVAWDVPAPVAGGFANVDVQNECTGNPAASDYASQLTTQVIDAGGSEITAYLFGDNYYEFYVNGEFAGRDAVNFTPFNSHAARFQVSYPVTYAVLLVDWEEYNGVGLESQNGGYHIGDGGFTAAFSDGTVTDGDWVCKAFYIAPLDDPSCVTIDANGNPDSSACPSSDQQVSCVNNDPENSCQALHVALPDNWMQPGYDDSGWLSAATYTADRVTNSNAYTDYGSSLFAGADFIWTSNLNLDNAVVCRTTVTAP